MRVIIFVNPFCNWFSQKFQIHDYYISSLSVESVHPFYMDYVVIGDGLISPRAGTNFWVGI